MQVIKPLGPVLVLCLCLPGAVTGASLPELRALQGILEEARSDFASRAGQLSDAEAADYRAYIAQLSERLAAGCHSYIHTGAALPADVECPAYRSHRLPPADIDQRKESTQSEKTATMDSELEAGLGRFDELLLREQERVKAATPPTSAAGAGSGSGTGSEGSGSGSGAGEGRGDAGEAGQAGTETGVAGATGGQSGPGQQPSSPTSTSASGAGGSAGPPGGRTTVSGSPPDLPDGSDDDVVARQMREAAENETDPELKEKLWEEYRRYKRGVR